MTTRVKKWNLLGALAALLIVWLLAFFFLDPLIKRALVSAGQAAAGAKVEIGSVRTRLLKGSFEATGIAVANKNEPMKNLLELSRAELKFSPSGALRAKAVVDDAALSGIRFGTARKTSGALPRTEPSAFERMIREQLSPVKQEVKTQAAKIVEVDPKKLASKDASEAARKKLDELEARAKSIADVEGFQARLKELEKEKNPLLAAQKGQALLAELKKAKEESAKAVAEAKAAAARVDELRKKDLEGLLAEAGLPALDAESLTRRLIGPAAAGKLSQTLYWVRWARAKQAKSQAKKAKEAPVTRKGANIEFPVKNALPAFLLKRAGLDAQAEGFDLKGELAGVSSNPPLYGKPSTLTLSGEKAGASLRLDGRMDQTRDDGPTELRLSYAGFPLSGMTLGEGDMTAALGSGTGRLDGTLKVTGERWSGRFVLDASGVTLEPKLTGLDERAARAAATVLKGIKRFTATVGVEGAGDDLKLSITSDLGKALAEGLKAAASNELLAQRKELEKKLDAVLGPQAKALQERTGALQAKLLAPLEKQQAELEQRLKAPLKNLKLFR